MRSSALNTFYLKLELENGKQIKKAHKELTVEAKIEVTEKQPPKIEKLVIKKRKVLKEYDNVNDEACNEDDNEEKINDEFEFKYLDAVADAPMNVDTSDEDFELKVSEAEYNDDDDDNDGDDCEDDKRKQTVYTKDTDFSLKSSKKKPVAKNVNKEIAIKKEKIVLAVATAAAPPPSKKPKKESKLRKKLQKLYKRF